MKFDVISVGSAVIDVFLYTGAVERKGQLCYTAGSKILVNDLEVCTGGGGTNTSVAFSRLGLKAGYLGDLGGDVNADAILKELKKEKVAFLGEEEKKLRTGFSVILNSRDRERTVLSYKGANQKLEKREIKTKNLQTKWFYFSSMEKESFRTQEKLAEFAEKKGIKIAFNPSSYQTKWGAEKLKKILSRTSVLILNKEEARMLTKGKDLFLGLHKLGPKIVCITDGPNGNEVSDGILRYKSFPHNIKIVERTGAGDAFASGFVAGIIKNMKMEDCIKLGSVNAESVIRYVGAKNKLLKWNEALKEIKMNPVRVIKKEIK